MHRTLVMRESSKLMRAVASSLLSLLLLALYTCSPDPAFAAEVVLAIDPLTAIAIGSTIIGGASSMHNNAKARRAAERDAQWRRELQHRMLQQAEEAFRQKAPLRNIGLGGLARFFSGQETPSVFTGQRTPANADPFQALGSMFGGAVSPQRSGFLFPSPEVFRQTTRSAR